MNPCPLRLLHVNRVDLWRMTRSDEIAPAEGLTRRTCTQAAHIRSGCCGRRQARNEQGGFFCIFQHNKWRARQQRLADAARMAAPMPA